MRLSRRKTFVILGLLIAGALAVAIERRRHIFRYLNVGAILTRGLDGRLVPHRVNRLEALRAVLDRGLRSLEVDVLFRARDAGGYFEVGHDEGDARGVRLDEFLEVTRAYELKKLWLDVKNLDAANMSAAVEELGRLDREFGLRDVAIVESYTTADELAAVGAAGFHSSYYVPEAEVAALLEGGDANALRHACETIAARLRRQDVRAVSFRLGLYPFVKHHLEPLLPAGIRYHGWDFIDLRRWAALEDLESRDCFGDPRVATIIYQL